MIHVKGRYGATYEINEEEGRVYRLGTKTKGKKEVVTRMLYKGFERIEEAYEYLSKTERLPVWKLRMQSKKVEAQK